MHVEEIQLVPIKTVASRNLNPRVFLGLVAVALIIAAFSGAGLAWDGSYFFYKLLDSQAPFIVHYRWFVLPLQLPAFVVSQFSGNQTLLQILFSLPYTLVPLLGLALCWWVVRDRQPGLFVWAAFGIGLVTLPGQFFFVGEANISLQIFWPVILAVLIGLPKPQTYLVGVLCILTLLGHPFAVGLFVGAALLAGLRGWRYPTERRYMLGWAAAFVLMTVLTVLKFWLLHSDYEGDQLSVGVLGEQFQFGVLGLPLVALVLTAIASLLVFAGQLVSFYSNPALFRIIRVVELGCLAGAGVVLVVWATNPHAWDSTINFRLWAFFFSLPPVGLATLESLRPAPPDELPAIAVNRHTTIGLIGLIFLVVLVAQSTSWLGLTNRLRETTEQNGYACLPADSTALKWAGQTVMGHWSVTARSLLLSEGRTSERVVQPGAGCTDQQLNTSFQLTPWERANWQGGWFENGPLAQKLAGEQKTRPACQLALTSGWYDIEQNDKNWWRWNGGESQAEIYSPGDGTVSLNGIIRTLQNPNQVDVVVNGRSQGIINISWDDMRPFPPVALQLKAGPNQLKFVSRNSARQSPNESRALAVAIGNLSLSGEKFASCQIQNR